MSDLPPRYSDRRNPLGFDEFIAILVAFATVGAILFWTLGRRGADEPLLGGLLLPPLMESPTPEARRELEVIPEAAPLPTEPAPTPLPTLPPTVPTMPPTGVAPVPVPVPLPASPVPPRVVRPAPIPVVVPPASPDAAVTFPDVPETYWAYPFIADLTRRGIIDGFPDGSFQPEQPVNRAQFAALLKGVLPEEARRQQAIAFNDVSPEFWGSPAIDAAVKADFLRGFPDNTFQPEQPISRMQVLLALTNGFRLPLAADPAAALQDVQDRDQIPAWAQPAIAAAKNAGLMVNHPTVEQFRPNQAATRAEVAAMLYQALSTTGQLPPIESQYIVRP
ncbi:MAG: S-layer homology domain-containing protein [Synechococcales cyanobacterium M58_A2018_015]|nr:S-layer homology domain-containing protein [Synechococcales cyanobacterium M58_A2018_015]